MDNNASTFEGLTPEEQEIVTLFRELMPEAADQIMQQVHKLTTRQ